jgi:hypothetical protein
MLTQRDRNAYYKQIQEVQRTRAANLRKAMESAGGWEQLGRFVGLAPAFLRQMASANAQRAIGERLARKIECALGVPAGWLDIRHGNAQ